MGIDIEEVSRFSTNKYEDNKSFYKKIFSENEIKYCLNMVNPYPHFTARFCAKEATIKALNNKKINLRDIEIENKQNIPILKLPLNVKSLVSLSHTKKYAVACVIIFEE